jgi:putative ABC transport system ATP-binding protein
MLNASTQNIDAQNEHTYRILQRLGLCLDLAIERSAVEFPDRTESREDEPDKTGSILKHVSAQAGINLVESKLSDREIWQLVADGYPVVMTGGELDSWVFEATRGRRIECARVRKQVDIESFSRSQLAKLLKSYPDAIMLVTQPELMSNQHANLIGNAKLHQHPPPLRRYIALLKLDSQDITTLAIFALVAGGLSLSTPIAVEALVNVVSWGTAVQPLLILSGLLFAALGFGAILIVLQNVIAEVIQRRQFARIVGDLAHRLPRASREDLQHEHPREIANRYFDIMSIQKATAMLLMDGIGIVLQVAISLILLAFYHPFLLGFDIILIICMVGVTLLLGRGGVTTSINESKIKYKVAHWLQDVIASPSAFKLHGGEPLAVDRANRLTVQYLRAREMHFEVLLRQITFAAILYAVAMTALLGLGGWLVISMQLTLGQLIASELVITVVMSAFVKAGKSIETFYDVMAATDKVGQMLDLVPEDRESLVELPDRPLAVRWERLDFGSSRNALPASVEPFAVKPGERIAVVGGSRSGGKQLLEALSGLSRPTRGIAEIGGLAAHVAAFEGSGRLVGYAGMPEIFHGTLVENIELGRTSISQARVREVLAEIGMWDTVLRLPKGMETELQTDGHPLSGCQLTQLTIARAVVAEPGLVLIDRILDDLTRSDRRRIWNYLQDPQQPWTLIITTNQPDIYNYCDRQLELKED